MYICLCLLIYLRAYSGYLLFHKREIERAKVVKNYHKQWQQLFSPRFYFCLYQRSWKDFIGFWFCKTNSSFLLNLLNTRSFLLQTAIIYPSKYIPVWTHHFYFSNRYRHLVTANLLPNFDEKQKQMQFTEFQEGGSAVHNN